MPKLKSAPKDFAELIEEAPQLVPHAVKNFLRFSSSKAGSKEYTSFEADYEEYLQETYLWLMSLPEDSKHRERGCTDRIQVYDASLCPSGLSVREHFKTFMLEIIYRFLTTYRTQRFRDAMERETQPLEPHTIVVVRDLTKDLFLRECKGALLYFTEKHPKGRRVKKGNITTLAQVFGFTTPDEAERLRGRVNRYLNSRFSSISK